MFVGYLPVTWKFERSQVMSQNRCVPLIFDYVELRLRMPVRRLDDPFLREAGVALPISRVL